MRCIAVLLCVIVRMDDVCRCVACQQQQQQQGLLLCPPDVPQVRVLLRYTYKVPHQAANPAAAAAATAGAAAAAPAVSLRLTRSLPLSRSW
jgi:hypothetical protein